jgi:hypothetical protein
MAAGVVGTAMFAIGLLLSFFIEQPKTDESKG